MVKLKAEFRLASQQAMTAGAAGASEEGEGKAGKDGKDDASVLRVGSRPVKNLPRDPGIDDPDTYISQGASRRGCLDKYFGKTRVRTSKREMIHYR